MKFDNFILIQSKDELFDEAGLIYWRLFDKKGLEFIPFSDFSFYVLKFLYFYNKRKAVNAIVHFIDYSSKNLNTSFLENENNKNEFVQKFMLDYFHFLLKSEIKVLKYSYPNIKNVQRHAKERVYKKLNTIDGFLCFCELIVNNNNIKEIKGVGRGSFFKQFNLNCLHDSRTSNEDSFKQYKTFGMLSKNFDILNLMSEKHIERGFALNIISKRPIPIPIIALPDFLKNCYYYRDLAIYSLMAGTGLKASQVLALKKDQIDFYNQDVFLIDETSDVDVFSKDNNYKKKQFNNLKNIENILNYDLANLKNPIKNILNYDLGNLGKPISEALFYDLKNLKNPITDILFYDIEKIWRSTKDEQQKMILTQRLLDDAYEKRNIIEEDEYQVDINEIENMTYLNEDEIEDFEDDEKHPVFFIQHLKDLFFYALKKYYEIEYVKDSDHDYVFQFLVGDKVGEPYYQISRQGFKKTFYRNLIRSDFHQPKLESELTPYSLRYFYMIYVINYLKQPNGKFGLGVNNTALLFKNQQKYQLKKFKTNLLLDLEAQKEFLKLKDSFQIKSTEDLLLFESKKYKEFKKI